MVIHYVAIDFFFEDYEDGESSKEQRGVKDTRLLLSAFREMEQTYDGQELYPTVFEKAACLVRGIIKNHPFFNANKRTGVLAMIVFLEMNNYLITPRGNQVIHFARGIAIGSPSIPRIVRTIKKWCKPLPRQESGVEKSKWTLLFSWLLNND